jgi:hypothetical protein
MGSWRVVFGPTALAGELPRALRGSAPRGRSFARASRAVTWVRVGPPTRRLARALEGAASQVDAHARVGSVGALQNCIAVSSAQRAPLPGAITRPIRVRGLWRRSRRARGGAVRRPHGTASFEGSELITARSFAVVLCFAAGQARLRQKEGCVALERGDTGALAGLARHVDLARAARKAIAAAQLPLAGRAITLAISFASGARGSRIELGRTPACLCALPCRAVPAPAALGIPVAARRAPAAGAGHEEERQSPESGGPARPAHLDTTYAHTAEYTGELPRAAKPCEGQRSRSLVPLCAPPPPATVLNARGRGAARWVALPADGPRGQTRERVAAPRQR